MTTHYLKTWPNFYQEIVTGDKTFEIRNGSDRFFQSGDTLILQEYDPVQQVYTGREIIRQVGFLLRGEWGLKLEYVCMSLLPMLEGEIK